jgi:NADH-quinone oxidoreductase subunit J
LNHLPIVSIIAAILTAWGIWWLLPPGDLRKRAAGGVLAAIALGLWASLMPTLGDWLADGVFYVLSGVTVVAAACAITFRNPVYCAIWFGLSLLGTAGLLLLIGAQFLAVATVVVYAGAILVTFLFVLMLAQPEGRAIYDRTSWEGLLSAVAGAMIVLILTMTISSVLGNTCEMEAISGEMSHFSSDENGTVPLLSADDKLVREEKILAPEHVARLGGELFGRHLLAVEVAGTLLLAALVGAAVISTQIKTKQEDV